MRALNNLFLVIAAAAFASACGVPGKSGFATGIEKTYVYGPDTTYSRAISIRSDQLYLGNSNGIIYQYDLEKEKATQLNTRVLPEIRDLAISGNKIVAMQSADSSCMIVYSARNERVFPVAAGPVFLDGMDILPSGIGFLMGDPVDGYFSLYKTADGGISWQETETRVKAIPGEAGFAASGTNVQCLNDSTFIFVSGGMQSRFFRTTNHGKTWSDVPLPFEKSEGSGAFSVHFINDREGVVVGGDYSNPSQTRKTCYYTHDGGFTWQESANSVSGYRSCVLEHKAIWYACGTNGLDISSDGGITWKRWLEGNYIAMVAEDNYLYLTVPKGKVVRVELP